MPFQLSTWTSINGTVLTFINPPKVNTVPCSLFPVPCFLFPVPCSLFPILTVKPNFVRLLNTKNHRTNDRG
ncbi:MAG: hypothetical protein F6K26_02590 [Moorea sp. SIO2I5]|nr:hypothetical protein [Moorena sp. SIO2I5]